MLEIESEHKIPGGFRNNTEAVKQHKLKKYSVGTQRTALMRIGIKICRKQHFYGRLRASIPMTCFLTAAERIQVQ
ncbi:CLUMA_CG002934, isoform A [Clunio marinus]|uniref:CLUMA_CG002934, isoform A n=1 Tax=Clunio marinus TaxID=568069 RepID=A0A1J1HMA5_9DIPT|nr:CLUMA_CG002934, isoform A [Clunio marinus]